MSSISRSFSPKNRISQFESELADARRKNKELEDLNRCLKCALVNHFGYPNTQKVNRKRIQDLTEDIQNHQERVDLYFFSLSSTRVEMNNWMAEPDQKLSAQHRSLRLRRDKHSGFDDT